jgi:porphobilinogen deaminase
LTGEAQGTLHQAEELGQQLADDLLERGAGQVLKDLYGN